MLKRDKNYWIKIKIINNRASKKQVSWILFSSFNCPRIVGGLRIAKRDISSKSISKGTFLLIQYLKSREKVRVCFSDVLWIFYFFLSLFLLCTSLFISHNTFKGIIPKEISRRRAEELATFFIPSRSRNVHFSPGALMQRRRGRRRFIAVLTFSAIRFSPATGWPWSKWNLLSSTRCATNVWARLSVIPLLFFSRVRSRRLMNSWDILRDKTDSRRLIKSPKDPSRSRGRNLKIIESPSLTNKFY